MGFNFGAFAGGLADGIEKGEKIRAAAEERKRKEKEAAAATAKAKTDKITALSTKKTDTQTKLSDLDTKINELKNKGSQMTAADAELLNSLNRAKDTMVASYNASVNSSGLNEKEIEQLSFKQSVTRDVELLEVNGQKFPIPKGADKNAYALNERGNLQEKVFNQVTGKYEQEFTGQEILSFMSDDTEVDAPKTKQAVIDGVAGLYTEKEIQEAKANNQKVGIVQSSGKIDKVWIIDPVSKKQKFVTEDEASDLVNNKGWTKLYKPEVGRLTSEQQYVEDYVAVNQGNNIPDAQLRMLGAKEYKNLGTTGLQKELTATETIVNNAEKLISDKYNTDLASLDFDTLEDADKKKLRQQGNAGIYLKLDKNKANETIQEVSNINSRAEKLLGSADQIITDLQSGENINVVKQTVVDYFSTYFGYSKDEAERVANSKNIVEVMNQVRHSLYGSVLTPGENKNFMQQASSLYRTNQDMVLGVKSLIESSISKMEAVKESIGDELFKMQFGNKLDHAQARLDSLNKVIKGEEGRTSTQKALDRAKSKNKKKRRVIIQNGNRFDADTKEFLGKVQ